MEERINQALTQIEADLQSIQSAREQVGTVVQSHKELQRKVETFVSAVANLSQHIESLSGSFTDMADKDLAKFNDSLEAMRKSCSGFIDLMNRQSEQIVSEFANNANNSAASIKKEVSNLHTGIETISGIAKDWTDSISIVKTLKSDIENLLAELNATQSVQDGVLNAIDAKNDGIGKTLAMQNSQLNQLQQTLNEIAEDGKSNKESLRKLNIMAIILLVITILGFLGMAVLEYKF